MKENSKNKLDQYFTKRDIAEKLFNTSIEVISKYENIKDYIWVEPSSGDGCFFDLLPKNKRIGIDLEPRRSDLIKSDFLKFELPKNKFIVIGNPPFGRRGVLALEFMNHSINADFICFILPMFFQSKGKGSIQYRVKNHNLLHSEILPENSFYTVDDKNIDVKCVFQIWSKNYSNPANETFNWYKYKKENPFKKYLDVFTVSTAKNRECGKKWIYEEQADYYLSSTFYKENKVVKKFEDVKYGSGIAIKINTTNIKEKNKIQNLIEKENWVKYSSLATNSRRHI
ncbi:hypothetical protein NWE59_03855 [Mycoplasmopsis felis]|uniref:hypothetical protein n=1 Tax=Mycoplasmopsis felis TaxID=33923 RepID=UPI0021AF2401|nr:hypothetical protein [Mycoplasmopsis felis]UWV78069.1 hypothetical protein NWE59_03855 [Mycoplasmopsis felis]